MNHLFDTCILIEIARGNKSLISKLNTEDKLQPIPAITMATYSEYYYGFVATVPKEQQICLNFLEEFQHLTLTKGSAKKLAELKHKYKKQGLTFSTMDLFNASVAIEENLMLVTMDKSFGSIKELKSIIID